MSETEFAVFLLVLILVLLVFPAILRRYSKYDRRGFDKDGIHRNGTRYNRAGYDVNGYDRDGYDYRGYDRRGFNRHGYDRNGYDAKGYDRNGYDRCGYDAQGYGRSGYNRQGRNTKGQYNRAFDDAAYDHSIYSADGFLSTRCYPVIVTNHARERIEERMPVKNRKPANELAYEAYCYGKSKRQVRKSTAASIEEIENKREDGIVLLYQGYVYIFSSENKLITVYKNESIML